MTDPLAPRALPAALATALSLAATGCISINFPYLPEELQETVVYGEEGPKILMIQIDGVITEEPQQTSLLGITQESMVARLREELRRAREDDEIKALLLRINSPGGTVTASDLIYEEILQFKEEQHIPVIAQLMSMATSGGYYIAMAADEVIAHPTSVTGSIGVIFFGVNLSGLMEKIGVEDQSLTTGPFKDAGSMLRPMRPEERAQLESVLADMFVRFKEVVDQGRPNLSAEQIDGLADGRIYSAQQASEAGLVDGIGSLEASVARAEARAGLETSRVVTYHRPTEFRDNLYTKAPRLPASIELDLDVLPDWPGLDGPAFLYLWAPGAH
jgi:protease-4